MFISLNIPRHGGIKIAIEILSHIKYPGKEWSRPNVGKWFKQWNKHFLIIKFKKTMLTNKRLWDLMDWIKKWNLSTVEGIKFNGHPCNILDNL